MIVENIIVKLSLLSEYSKKALFEFMSQYEGKIKTRYNSDFKDLVKVGFISEVLLDEKQEFEHRENEVITYDLYNYDLGRHGIILYDIMFEK